MGAPTQKPPSYAERWQEAKATAAENVNFSVSKEEKKILEPEINKLKAKPAPFSPSFVTTELRRLDRKPFNLSGRSPEAQIAFLSIFIGKMNQNPNSGKQIKQRLLARMKNLTTIGEALENENLNATLKNNDIDTEEFQSREDTKKKNDPLFTTPRGIPMNESFYGKFDLRDLLPEGTNPTKEIPPDYKELLKNTDALGRVAFKVGAKYFYNPIAKWYRGLGSPASGILSPLMGAVHRTFKTFVSSFNARSINKVRDVSAYIKKKLSAFTGDVLNTISEFIEKIADKAGISSLVKKGLAGLESQVKKITGLGLSEMKSIMDLALKAVGQGLDIAARSRTNVERHRINNKPRCFFQNKLYILLMMQHQQMSAKGNRKFALKTSMSLMMDIVANLKSDKDLRNQGAKLKPGIKYLALRTSLGFKLASLVGFGDRWKKIEKSKRPALMQEILNVIWPSQNLTKAEKGSKVNKFILSMHNQFIEATAKHTDGDLYNPKQTRVLLAINMLFDNVRIQLVSGISNPQKTQETVDRLVGVMEAFSKSLSSEEKAAVPALAVLLANPRLYIEGLVASAKAMKVSSKGAGTQLKAALPLIRGVIAGKKKYAGNTEKIKAAIKGRLESISDSRTLISMGIAEDNTPAEVQRKRQSIIRIADTLRHAGRSTRSFADLHTSMSALSRYPDLFKTYFPLFHAQMIAEVPAAIRAKIDLPTVQRALEIKSKTNILYIANIACDKITQEIIFKEMKNASNVAYAFKALVLSRLKGRPMTTRGALSMLITTSLKQSLKGTNEYAKVNFEKLKKRISKILSWYYPRKR